MDCVDITVERGDILLTERIRADSLCSPLTPTGFCLNPECGDPIDPSAPNQKFCDAKCRDAYDRHEARKKGHR